MAPKGPGNAPGAFPGGGGPKANPVNIAWPFLRAMALVQTRVPGSAFVSQVVIEALYQNPGLAARLSQETIEVLTRVGIVIVGPGQGNGHGGGHKAKIIVIEVGGLANAKMPAPSVKGGFTVQAVAAKATAHFATPVVHGDKLVAAPAAKATAVMPPPVVSSGGTSVTVHAVACAATAIFAPPAVSPPAASEAPSGGGRIIMPRVPVRTPQQRPKRRRSQTIYAEPAMAVACTGRHLILDDSLDAEFVEFFEDLLTLDLIAA